MKWFQAEAMRSGSLPLIDPYRAGGQPHLGNPNTVPLYPDNLLYLLAPPIWAMNAHFWLHLLLAPVAFFFLARRWGLGREASWASGVIYATSGYYLSTLNLYNLTAGATLAPAFVAVCLALAGGSVKRRTWVAGTLLWALLVLGGDPLTAVVALVAGGAAMLLSGGWRDGGARFRGWGRLLWVVVLGSLVAAPQIVEFLRILPGSYRGVQGYSVHDAMAASWGPANVLEWFIPMAFGEPTLLYWGARFSGDMPLFYSVYPGVIALAAMAAGFGVRDRRSRWILLMIAVGVFLALGRYNPAVPWLMGLPGMSILRLPSKLWLLVAMGTSLMAGVGLHGLIQNGARTRLQRSLLLLGGLMAGGTVFLVVARGLVSDLVAGWMPDRIPVTFAAEEVSRWILACALSAVLLAAAYLLSRSEVVSGAALVGWLLALHVLGQVWLLQTLVPTDSVAAYGAESALLAQIPPDALVVQGEAGGLFGPEVVRLEDFPDEHLKWLQRDTFSRLYPTAGVMAGRRYGFWTSPEGLGSFLARRMALALPILDDPKRLALLEASGVTHLLMGRELEGVGAERAKLLARGEIAGRPLLLYRLLESAEEVQWVGRVLRAEDARRAVAALIDPTFDPRSAVVLAGSGEPTFGVAGEVERLEIGPEEIVVRARADGPGAVVFQRSYLPIYEATIDGDPAPIEVANMHRMAVEVPAGDHEIRLRVDDGSLRPAFLLSLLGLVLLGLRLRR
jgi:hypothetical protein